MKPYKSYIYCFLAILFFSTHEIIGKFIDSSITPIAITFYRFIIGGLLISIYVFFNRNKFLPVINLKYIIICSCVGALNVCISMYSLQLAIFYGQASFAAIIIGANSLFVSIFGFFILKEKLSSKNVICLIVGCIGMGIVILGNFSNIGDSKNVLLGVFFAVLASITFALYTVLSKQQILKSNIHFFNSVAFSAGAIFLLIFGVFTNQDMSLGKDLNIIIAVIYLGVVVTCLAYFLLFEGIRNINSSIGASFFFLKPVFVSILAYFLLNETLNLTQILGIVVVFGSMTVQLKLK